MRIGLYGGCFNPVHAGHLAAARGAREALALDEVLFIPSGHPPLKGNAGLVAGAHRLAMIERAIADEPGMAVSSIEIDRDGPSFTVDTVRTLRAAFPAGAELFFLLGDDCLRRLPRWKGIDELHEMLRFAILPRSGQPEGEPDSRLIWLPLAPLAVSSTEVRAMAALGQNPPAALVPAAVS
uniref:nicotinate-nucleotide adenylyltransferase n=1 Tax=Novosphingobium sp. TaxID=1874826 RepID=UPI0026335B6C